MAMTSGWLHYLYNMQSDALEALEPGSARAASAGRLASESNVYSLGEGKRAANCRSKV